MCDLTSAHSSVSPTKLVGFMRGSGSIPVDHELVEGQTLATLWRIAFSVTQCEQRVWYQPRVETERFDHLLRTEERCAHPAGVETEVVGGEQRVLGRGPQRLHGHRGLAPLALRIGVDIQVLEVEAEQYEHRRVPQASAGAFETLLDDLRPLAVHLQVGPPLLAHRIGQTLFGLFTSEHGEAPGLPAVGGRGPPGGFEYPLYEILRHPLVKISPDGAAATNRVEDPRL